MLHEKHGKALPSDIMKEQFERTAKYWNADGKRPLLAKSTYTKSSAHPLFAQKRLPMAYLPEVFSNWNTVYYYFSIWNKQIDERLSLSSMLKKVVGAAYIKTGGASPTRAAFLI